MKRLLFAVLSISFASFAFGQGEESSFTSTGRGGVATTFASDYEAIGLNPANLGMAPKYEGKNFSLGMAEFGMSFYSQALNKPNLKKWINSTVRGEGGALSKDEKQQAAKDFITNPLTANVDVLNIGFSAYSEKFGGIGFTVKDRISYFSSFNENFADMLFTGYDADYFTSYVLSDSTTVLKEDFDTSAYSEEDIVKGIRDAQAKLVSDLFDGTRLTMNWYKEYNVTYSRGFTINDDLKLYGGLGLKYIQGIASLDINFEDGNLSESSYSAISAGIPVNYGDLGSSGSQEGLDTVNNGMFGLPEAVGTGFGADLGFNVLLGEWDIGIAVTDLGGITYNKNVYTVNDVSIGELSSNGMNSYNLLEEAANFTSEGGAVDWEKIDKKKVGLPTVVRTGVSYTHELTEDRKIEFGADIVLPMNNVAGSYRAPLIGIGGDINLLKWLNVSTGFVTGGNMGNLGDNVNVPMGITIDVGNGTYEFGIATRDILYYFTDSTPTISMSMGFLRFRI